MSCRFASRTDEYHGWKCSESDGACMYFVPDEQRCYDEYGEGPLAFEENPEEIVSVDMEGKPYQEVQESYDEHTDRHDSLLLWMEIWD